MTNKTTYLIKTNVFKYVVIASCGTHEFYVKNKSTK